MSTATSDNESEPSHYSTRNVDSIRHNLGAIQLALDAAPPVVSGSIAVTPEQCILFYEGRDGSLGKLDFSNASPFEVEALESACDPATFGRNSEDVLDETYRKAGKLDVKSFASTLQIPSLHQIVNRVRSILAEGTESDGQKTIVAELYKLNTYGVGGFFKAHQDTPHSEDIFGSLVVILPIAHEGGDLVVRHAGDSWSFGFGDQPRAVKDDVSSGTSINYVAFYSDVEHEVLPVTSGCRVTLTFNLLWAPSKPTVHTFDPSSLSDDGTGTTVVIEPKLARLGAALSAALENPSFLPVGGTIGVHLQHRYPVGSRNSWKDNTTCKELLGKLKGSDRTLYRACLRNLFSAQVELQLYCDIPSFGEFLCRERFYLDNRDQVDDDELFAILCGAGAVALKMGEWAEESFENIPKRMEGEIEWVNSSQRKTWSEEEFISYGNEVQMRCAYYNACLLLKVGKARARTQVPGSKD